MIAHRAFKDYDAYVYHQGGKARGCRESLLKHLPKNIDSFKGTFNAASKYLKPGSILCLGARTGAENLGAVKAGFKGSVGIDLHPVGPTVLRGDWHSLQFAEASFANVYSNSLDHCLYLDRLAAEVQRVLKPDGRFYVMATNREGNTVEGWLANRKTNEALYWQTSDELCDELCGLGFKLAKGWHKNKWGHYVLKVRA